MDCKSRCIDRLISNHYISMLIYKNKIRDTNLGEVLRKWIEPEVIRQYRISDRAIDRQHIPTFSFSCEHSHMASNSFIESSLCKSANSKINSTTRERGRVGGEWTEMEDQHPKRSSKMLLPIQSLLLQTLKLRIRPNPQFLPILRPSETQTICASRCFICHECRCRCHVFQLSIGLILT
jgi:hypothetical protein